MKKIIYKIGICIVICGVLLFSVFKYNVNAAITPYYSDIEYINEYFSVQTYRTATYIEIRFIPLVDNMYLVKDGPCYIQTIDADAYNFHDSGYYYDYSEYITYNPEFYDSYFFYRWNYSAIGIDDTTKDILISIQIVGLAMVTTSEQFRGYLTCAVNIPLYDFADTYTTGYDDGYEIGHAEGYGTGYDLGYNTGYNTGYDEGIEHTEFVTTHWFSGMFDAISNFFSIQIGGMTLGGIILIPFSITFVWFILRAFRGGGSE